MFFLLLHLIFALTIYDEKPPIIGVDDSEGQAVAHIEFLRKFMQSGQPLPMYGEVIYYENYTIYTDGAYVSCLCGWLVTDEAQRQAANLVDKYNKIFYEDGSVKMTLPDNTYSLKSIDFSISRWNAFKANQNRTVQDYIDVADNTDFVRQIKDENQRLGQLYGKSSGQLCNKRLEERAKINSAIEEVARSLKALLSCVQCDEELKNLPQIENLISAIEEFNGALSQFFTSIPRCVLDRAKDFFWTAQKLGFNIPSKCDGQTGEVIYPPPQDILAWAQQTVEYIRTRKQKWEAEKEKMCALLKQKEENLKSIYDFYVALSR